MLCSVVVCCGLVSRKVVSCSVVCCGVLRSGVVCDLLWCVELCGGGSVLWSHEVPCGVLCFHVVRSGVMWCGLVSCLSGWLDGVLVAWQVGLFGSLGHLLGVWLVGAHCVVPAPYGVWCRMLLYAL